MQEIKAAMFELTTVGETVAKHHAKEILPASTYTTPAIPMYGEPCANPLVQQSHTLTHPAVYMAEVNNYKMIGGCAFPIVDNKCVKHQYFDVNEWETWEQAKKVCLIQGEIVAYRGISEYTKHDEEIKVINLTGNGSFNYAHWMTEFLPQLILLKQSSADLSKYKFLVSKKAFPSMLDAITLAGVDPKNIIFVADYSFHEFSSACWVSPVANVVFQRPNALEGGQDTLAAPKQAIFHPDTIKSIADYYLSNIDIDKNKEPELIYITRTPGRSKNQRIVLNEPIMADGLEKLGFVKVDPSKLSFKEQVAKFSNAKCIVSPSGAALLNMLWAPKGAHVVILMNDSKVANYWYFSNIAACLAHQVSYVLGKVVSTGNWTDINHADFLIDFKEVLKSIQPIEHLTKVNELKKLKQKLERFNNVKFAIIVHEAVVFSHYKNLLNKLDKNQFCILTKNLTKKGTGSEGNLALYNYLDNQGYLYESFSYAVSNNIKFPYVITNHVISNFYDRPISKLVGHKQIRFMYGADIGDGWSLQSWNEMYDYFLCHGENDKNAIESRFKGKTFIMGYPRYDGYFDPALDTQSVINEFRLDNTKKTILWMPTLGGDYSSIPRFAEKLKHLIGSYNFIIRPHPLSFVQEPDYIALLERCGYLIDRNAIRDMNSLYKVADIVLADNGGSPFSAIFMGKNVVFLEVPNDLGENPNSHHIVNTSVNALKQVLPVISEDCPERLEVLLESEEFYSENSHQVEALFMQYFNCPRGGGSQRVADFLNSLD
jgi:capsular polysaccharide biosynthesis protein